ncbi:MAG: TatD family hydrolase [Cellvibrionaceae bacterium]|nr:TatD family hydrolase [Cellvibrionaceae bacterium]
MQTEFFDTHCHFDFEDFDADREELWQKCRAQGVRHMLIPGVAPDQWARMQALCQTHSGIYFAAGLHPCWLQGNITLDAKQLDALKEALRDKSQTAQCVAIGECGLDQYIDGDEALQEAVLESHLEIAQECDKPIILHCRRAHNSLLRCLKRNPVKRGGILHAYSGSREQAEQYWQMGFYLGIGGTISYERANKTRTAVKELPLEALVLETDAPDMPLCGHQGKRNTPLHIPDVARILAELRNQPFELIAQQTTLNAKNLFHIAP